MDRIRALRNPIRHYAWGSHEALARWSGRPAPSDEPEAELWLGAHPSGPSEVALDDGSWESLERWIGRNPRAALGDACDTAGAELPFLLKVLAPARALSLQTHPSEAQARAGFAREEAAGVPRDAPERCFRDPNPKPELVCALTSFSALCDLRPRADVSNGLRALALPELAPIAERVEAAGTAEGLAALLAHDPASRGTLAERAAAAARGRADDGDAPCALVVALAEQHPRDVGALAALFLNRVELAPGQALFLEAGRIHAYLGGLAVEVMACSDNTLRAGLTGRHVDVPEFLAALDDREGAPELLAPRPLDAATVRYAAPTDRFELRRVSLDRGVQLDASTGGRPAIWLCTRGEVAIAPQPGEPLPLAVGDAVWVPAAARAFQVAATADAELHVATLPPSGH